MAAGVVVAPGSRRRVSHSLAYLRVTRAWPIGKFHWEIPPTLVSSMGTSGVLCLIWVVYWDFEESLITGITRALAENLGS